MSDVKLQGRMKSCPCCGNDFECKADAIALCHCSSVELTEQERRYLQQNYSGCLCQTCIDALKRNNN